MGGAIKHWQPHQGVRRGGGGEGEGGGGQHLPRHLSQATADRMGGVKAASGSVEAPATTTSMMAPSFSASTSSSSNKRCGSNGSGALSCARSSSATTWSLVVVLRELSGSRV